ncbi:type II secretion system F family protein [Micrococcoides hystricis]|uniref:Type II secretion system F family protein n=1 Tax=Micrococcoides hystricis TaxID=1572761 RepID=A0ABV6PF74_9MICC
MQNRLEAIKNKLNRKHIHRLVHRQQFLRQLAALLKAGRHSQQLWEELSELYNRADKDGVTEIHQFVEQAGSLSNRGENPAEAFQEQWPWLASCFRMAAGQGMQLADLLERYSNHVQEDQSLDELIVVEAAGAKMTQRLLLLLPFGGIGMSLLLGVDVVGIYFGHPLGLLCLVLGAVLSLLAARTSKRIIAEAGRRQ